MPPRLNTYTKKAGLGSFGEAQVSQVLTACGLTVGKNRASDRKTLTEWDLEASGVGGLRFTVEVKFDVMAARTGNIAVEYFNTKQAKPSGIKATTADLWAFVLTDPPAVYIASTSALRHHFDTVKPVRDVACGGDDNAAMKLFRRDELLAAVPFHRVDDLPAWEVVPLIRSLLGPTRGPSCAECDSTRVPDDLSREGLAEAI